MREKALEIIANETLYQLSYDPDLMTIILKVGAPEMNDSKHLAMPVECA
jgi:hypothetical protein